MRAAIAAVCRKETLTLLQNFGGNSRLTQVLWLVALFSGGLVLPMIIGEYWLRHAGFLVVFPILGGVLVTQNIIDSVAGERERKTLETLLSTPVPSAAVVIGKILPTVTLAAMISLGNLLMGMIIVNVAFWSGAVQWPEPYLLIGLPLLSVLFPLLTVSAGFFGSVTTDNTRQATQVYTLTLTAVLIVPPVALLLLPEDITAPLLHWWQRQTAEGLMGVVLVGLFVLDAFFLAVCLRSFRRQQLLRAA